MLQVHGLCPADAQKKTPAKTVTEEIIIIRRTIIITMETFVVFLNVQLL